MDDPDFDLDASNSSGRFVRRLLENSVENEFEESSNPFNLELDLSPESAEPVELEGNSTASQDVSLGASAKCKPSPQSSSAWFDSSLNISHAFNSLEPIGVQHFWENGFWANVFTEDGPVQSNLPKGLKRPVIPADIVGHVDDESEAQPALSKLMRTDSSCHFSEVVRSGLQLSWKDEREAQWETAIRRWHALVLTWVTDSPVVQSVRGGANFREQSQVLVDVFFNKAPSTLLKRCYGLTKICSFLKNNGLSFPCSESDFYNFMCHERTNGAPSSRLKSCLESLVFCRHMLGITELDSAINSRRCLGTTYRSVHDKIQQASPLTVAHLKYLHERLESDKDLWNKVFIGTALFCCYGRSRWSDAQHCERLIPDRDEAGKLVYVEGETAVHKTCRALQMRFVFLPLVAPCIGITGSNWAEVWLDCRKQLDIESLSEWPLMPSPDSSGAATVRPLSTEEAGKWLRMILTDGAFDISAYKFTSHTFKCTFLSYCAKRGISLEDRRILGYHAEGSRVPLRYSRDSASRPLAVLENLILEIYHDKFRPDCTRSGRLVDDSGVASSVVKVEDGFEVINLDESSDEESGHVTTSSDESESDTRVPFKEPRLFWNKHVAPDGTCLWQHKKLKTLHLANIGYKKVFICNRPINDNYIQCSEFHRYDTPKCKCCFNSFKKPES